MAATGYLIPTSNVSLQNLHDAFNASAYALNAFYSGGSFVAPFGPPANSGYGTIPSSGTISLGLFRGFFVFIETITADTVDYNLKTRAIANGWDQSAPLEALITIAPGITVYGSNPSTPAFSTGTTFSANSVIRLKNNGVIAGAGGAGGTGDSINDAVSITYPGQGGGLALSVTAGLIVFNNGIIGGGGGGGGAGASARDAVGDKTHSPSAIGGAGGGGGAGFGAAGAGGRVISSGQPGFSSGLNYGANGLNGNSGVGGTATVGGAGGAGRSIQLSSTPAAGAGGSLGAAGTNSTASGGAAGAAVSGNANITWINLGTRLGAIS